MSPREVRRVLPTYHVFLLLSDYEGLPLALLEAASAGLVPICTPVQSGVGELVEHELSGIFVDNRTASLAAPLQRLQKDAELWDRCSQEIRKRSLCYRLECSGEAWLGLLEEVRKSQPYFRAQPQMAERSLPPVMKEFLFDDYERTVSPMKRMLGPLRRLLRKCRERPLARRASG